MIAPSTAQNTTRMPFLMRVLACILAGVLVACFQAAPISDAFAAESKKAATTNEAPSLKKDPTSPSTPEKKDAEEKTDKKTDKDKDGDKDEDEESEEEKQRREEAEEKRAEADALYSQASAAQASLSTAETKFNDACSELDDATAARDDAQREYDEKSVEIDCLQEDLSDYVVDMYKQGGATPYLDVVLRSTSYKEFLTSWNMTVTVTSYGHDLVVEKKQLRAGIEETLASSKERVKEAERAKALADSNRRQINATRLALLVQAANMSVEAAELEDNEDALEEAKDEAARAQEELDDAIEEGLAGESLLSGTGYFTHPCPNYTAISSGFGYRTFDNAVHKGMDFAAPEGTPYYAADSGTVIAATNGGGDNGGAGNWVVIDHGNGLVTKYMHSLVTFVSPGDHVDRGQNIGLVGTTGQSTGPHGARPRAQRYRATPIMPFNMAAQPRRATALRPRS